MAQPLSVGGASFRLSFDADGDLNPDPRPDHEAAADVHIDVQMFQDGEHFYCGQVIVSTNPRIVPWDPPNRVLAERDSHLTIDSRMWRAIRIGEMVELTAASIRETAEKVARDIGDEYLRTSAALPAPTATRGRRSPLTPEILMNVVVPAYQASPRRPVQAVRAALEACPDFLGSGPNGEVTIDQARKAVARARHEFGLLRKTTKGSRS